MRNTEFHTVTSQTIIKKIVYFPPESGLITHLTKSCRVIKAGIWKISLKILGLIYKPTILQPEKKPC